MIYSEGYVRKSVLIKMESKVILCHDQNIVTVYVAYTPLIN